MKILIVSTLFPPSTGGMETVMGLLADQLARCDQSVRVLTSSERMESPVPLPYEIRSKPDAKSVIESYRWCDVVCHSCISLRQLWPLAFVSRPLLAIHHTWYQRRNGTTGFQDWLKLRAARRSRNVAVSTAIAEHLGTAVEIIPNPYDDDLYRDGDGAARDTDLVFVGRLVSDKGVDIAIEALALLQSERQPVPNLTIIGDGPSRSDIERLVDERGLRSSVRLLGSRPPIEVASWLRRAHVAVIPSRWREPFGLVALEAIASGCVPVGTEGGGLGEAIGACGVLVPRENPRALATAVTQLLQDPDKRMEHLSHRSRHLAKHAKRAVAARYLAVLKELI